MTGPTNASASGAANITSGSRIKKLNDNAIKYILFYSFSFSILGKYLTISLILKLTGTIFYDQLLTHKKRRTAQFLY
ncbi:hypothetical protein MUP79_04140 [Candidatus Bathyarchaeota archaeon]|nr:hypothetical protein [Candidatus Bathyarchaeota archaeon]